MNTRGNVRVWDFAAAAIAAGLAVSELLRLAIMGHASAGQTALLTIVSSSAFVAVLAVTAIGVALHRQVGWLFGVLAFVTAAAHGFLLAAGGSSVGGVYVFASAALLAFVAKSLHSYRDEIVAAR